MKLGSFRRYFSMIREFIRETFSTMDYLMWLFLDPSKFTRIKTKEIDKILIVLIGSEIGNIGGNFSVLGVANYFRKINPSVKITFLLDRNTAKQFGEVPGIDFMIFSDKSTLKELKKMNFKAAIIYNTRKFKTKDLRFIPYRVDNSTTSLTRFFHPQNRFFVTRRLHVRWGKKQAVENQFSTFELLGFRFKKKGLIFYHSKEEEEKIKLFLRGKKTSKFVAMHPGGKFVVDALKKGNWPPFLWPLDRFARVADNLIKEGYQVLITGTKDESYLANKIKENSLNGNKIIDCCGKFNFRETGVLIKHADLLISPDTSVVYLASQVKTPILQILGPSPAELVRPWPKHSKINKIIVDKGPCYLIMQKERCPEGKICMAGITPEMVTSEAIKLLNK